MALEMCEIAIRIDEIAMKANQVATKNYEIAMKYCMMWLEHKEEYEYCAIVRDYLTERKTKSKKLSFEEQIHSLIS